MVVTEARPQWAEKRLGSRAGERFESQAGKERYPWEIARRLVPKGVSLE